MSERYVTYEKSETLLAMPTSSFRTRQTTTRLAFRTIAQKRSLSAMGRRSPSPDERYTSRTSRMSRSAPCTRLISHLTKSLQSIQDYVVMNKKTLRAEGAEADSIRLQCCAEIFTRHGRAV